jgi:hypothetical protein
MGADIEDVFQKAADLLDRTISAGELATDLARAQHDVIQKLIDLALVSGAEPEAVREVLSSMGRGTRQG